MFILLIVDICSIPEILIIGTGRYIQPVDPEIRKFIRSTGMKLEAIDSVRPSDTLFFSFIFD